MKKKESLFFHTGLFILSLTGVIAILISTRWGPGVGGDATIYMTCARNLIEGKGLGLIGPQGEFRLLPYFPPFFSLTLSFFGLIGADILKSAQMLNAVLFGAIIWISGMVFFRITGSRMFSWLTAGVVLGSPVLIPVYSWAMSEPLAIFLGFAGIWMILEAIWQPERQVYYYLSALVTGLAVMTRYNAAAFLGTAALFFFLFNKNSFWRKLWRSGLYFLMGMIPIGSWMIYDFLHTSTFSSRRVEVALSFSEHARYLWHHFSYDMLFWLIPDSWIYSSPYPGLVNDFLPLLAIILVVVWSSGIGITLWKRDTSNDMGKVRQFFVLLLIFILAFFSVITLVSATTYPPITINNRMISPIHIAVLWLVMLLGYLTTKHLDKKWIKVAIPVFLGLLIVWYGWRASHIVNQNSISGLGYTSAAWQQSEVIDEIRQLPEDIIVITNETNAVLFLTGRAAYPLKEIYFDHPLQEFSSYGNGSLENDDPQRLFREEGYPLVLFDTIDDQLSGLYGEQTAERISSLVSGLHRDYRGDDGGIFYYSNPD